MTEEATVDEIHDELINKPKGGFSGFASFGMTEDAGGEEEDFGGLMVGASAVYSYFFSKIHTVIVYHKSKQE